MKQLISLLPVIAMAFIQTSCKKIEAVGPVVSEKRNVEFFNKIELKFSGNVIFTQSGSKKVEVEASHNLQPYIITEVKDNILILRSRSNVDIEEDDITIYISNPMLFGIILNGNGSFSSATDISSSSFDIRVNGNGSIDLHELTANALDTEISGNGSIDINGGTVPQQKIKISGNGDYKVENMSSNEALVQTTGAGSAWLWAKEKLNVTITGRGDVWYKGSPNVSSSITGSGRIKEL